MASIVADPSCGRNPTSGGSSETEVKEPIVKPTGASPFIPVTTVTPVGKWPKIVRKWPESKSGVSLIDIDSTQPLA